jgi:hypothetical protein
VAKMTCQEMMTKTTWEQMAGEERTIAEKDAPLPSHPTENE